MALWYSCRSSKQHVPNRLCWQQKSGQVFTLPSNQYNTFTHQLPSWPVGLNSPATSGYLIFRADLMHRLQHRTKNILRSILFSLSHHRSMMEAFSYTALTQGSRGGDFALPWFCFRCNRILITIFTAALSSSWCHRLRRASRSTVARLPHYRRYLADASRRFWCNTAIVADPWVQTSRAFLFFPVVVTANNITIFGVPTPDVCFWSLRDGLPADR